MSALPPVDESQRFHPVRPLENDDLEIHRDWAGDWFCRMAFCLVTSRRLQAPQFALVGRQMHNEPGLDDRQMVNKFAQPMEGPKVPTCSSVQ
jgi:hypothetical protein